METASQLQNPHRMESPGTLGDVLGSARQDRSVPEADWVALVRGVASGDQVALHRLYERSHRLVFTLAMRMTGNREAAEEVTLDVFYDVWKRAARYEPSNGTVVGWVMNQARSRAIDRVRFEGRQKRVIPDGLEAPSSDDLVALRADGRALRAALMVLSTDERQAIEAAYFSECTHAEVAARLKVPLGTVKTRIRSGLQKLRKALDVQERKP